ncbi:MAG: PAS domain-containing protein, partial [Chthoniobacterales bacterium]
MTSQSATETAGAAAADVFSPAEMELLFEAHPAPMFIYSTTTLDLLAVNRAAIAQYGYPREEFLALNLRDLRPAEDVARLERIVSGLRGPSATGISRHQRKDGSLLIASIYSSPIRFENQAARMVVATDVT